jgi:hypothetical protein
MRNEINPNTTTGFIETAVDTVYMPGIPSNKYTA